MNKVQSQYLIYVISKGNITYNRKSISRLVLKKLTLHTYGFNRSTIVQVFTHLICLVFYSGYQSAICRILMRHKARIHQRCWVYSIQGSKISVAQEYTTYIYIIY